MGESYRLRSVTVEVEPRGDYLHVVLRGDLPTVADVVQLTSLIRHVMEKQAVRRLLVSARAFEHELAKDVCDACWAWLRERKCGQLAWVAPVGTTELTLATLNLRGTAESLAVGAFTTVVEGCRWLERRTTAERRATAATRDASPGNTARTAAATRDSYPSDEAFAAFRELDERPPTGRSPLAADESNSSRSTGSGERRSAGERRISGTDRRPAGSPERRSTGDRRASGVVDSLPEDPDSAAEQTHAEGVYSGSPGGRRRT